MKTTDALIAIINKLPDGYVFSFSDVSSSSTKPGAAIKALNRMVQRGSLNKLSKGRYYKPEQTPFGPSLPELAQVVRDLLEEGGKIKGYLTGSSIYNQLGLTTQVSSTIQIGKNNIRPVFKREQYTISFIQQKNIITKHNVRILQLLDVIRYIKKIPDTDLSTATQRLLPILRDLHEEDQRQMVRLALKYPPATKALLGAMLDELKQDKQTGPLYQSLNFFTTYKMSGIKSVLHTAEKWHIV